MPLLHGITNERHLVSNKEISGEGVLFLCSEMSAEQAILLFMFNNSMREKGHGSM